MMNGSQRTPAKARTPWAVPPCSSPTTKSTVSPLGVWHVPACGLLPAGSENTIKHELRGVVDVVWRLAARGLDQVYLP